MAWVLRGLIENQWARKKDGTLLPFDAEPIILKTAVALI